MDKEMWINLFFFFLFVILMGAIALSLASKEKKRQDKKQVTEFIRCLLASFHEVNTHINPDESKASSAKKITQHIRNHIGTEFRILMVHTTTFPRKCKHPAVDLSTKKLIGDIFPLLADIHDRYRKNPASLEDLKNEFFEKLEKFVFDSIMFDNF
jgi:hypothetical protein